MSYNPPPIPPKIRDPISSTGFQPPSDGTPPLQTPPYANPTPSLQAAEDYAPPPGPPPPGTFSRPVIPPPVPPRPPGVGTEYQIASASPEVFQPQVHSSTYQPPLPPRPLNAKAKASTLPFTPDLGAPRTNTDQLNALKNGTDFRPLLPQRPRPMSVAGGQVYTPQSPASLAQTSSNVPPPGPPLGPPPQPVQIESMLDSLSLGPPPSRPPAIPRPPSAARSPTAGSYYGTREPTPPAVTACIEFESTFPTTWYWHPETPGFLICSRCYVDSIHGTRFAGAFKSGQLTDGKTRKCLFSSRRMKDMLFPNALRSGSLDSAIEYMRFRPTIEECKGLDGVNGGNGYKWYQAVGITGFVSCHACFEECIVGTQLSRHFTPSPEGAHPTNETWACDMAIPYLRKEFEARAERNDWAGFVDEAKARLAMKTCPGIEKSSTYQVPWFVPIDGPKGLIICAACYCDQFLWTTGRSKWREATELRSQRGILAQCAFGYLNLKLCISRAHELKDLSVFWNAVNKLGETPMCSGDGIKDGIWYTLPSNPREFGICKACYLTLAEPLDISQFFARKTNIPAGKALICAFNPAYNRFAQSITKLLETYITRDPSPLEAFASVWSCIPRCARDEDKPNQRWYGWLDCTICPECYHNFASGFPSMMSVMELKDKQLPNNVMCEMYSPRMRALFKECAVSGEPPNLKPLLEYSLNRRAVYMQTVPQIRMIIFQQKMNANQQMMLNTMSTHHMVKGQIDQINYGYGPYTYGAAGVGYGFANMDMLQGAQLKQEAMGIVSGGMSATMQVGMLEQKWRAVE